MSIIYNRTVTANNIDDFIQNLQKPKNQENQLEQFLPRKNKKYSIQKIHAYRVIHLIKTVCPQNGISRNELTERILGESNKQNNYYITSILTKLSRNGFIYYKQKRWRPTDDLLYSSLMISDIWKLTDIPFTKSNTFFFFRKNWHDLANKN